MINATNYLSRWRECLRSQVLVVLARIFPASGNLARSQLFSRPGFRLRPLCLQAADSALWDRLPRVFFGNAAAFFRSPLEPPSMTQTPAKPAIFAVSSNRALMDSIA